MHTAHSTQPKINSVSVSKAADLEGHIEGQTAPLSVSKSIRYDDLPPTSQSWPIPSDLTAQYSSFRSLGEELDTEGLSDSFESFDPFDTALESSCPSTSPAAAFLSSFSSPQTTSPSFENIPGYALGATIGHGGFSVIKMATSSSGGVVAVKIIRHSAFTTLPPAERAKLRSRVSREGRIWVSLSHENILPLFDSFKTPEATYLMTLYCPAGSLLDILKRDGRPALEQTDVGYMFRQIVKALQYLHESVRLVHGDVKLENVMVDECGVCRLADFGLARHIGNDSSQVSSASDDDHDTEPAEQKEKRGKRTGTAALPVHLSLIRHGPQRHRKSSPLPTTETPKHPDHVFLPGSLPYAAPELLLPHTYPTEMVHGRTGRPIAHPAQDMWALGVLLYALLTGALPFRDPFEPRLQMKIVRGTYDMPPAIGQHAESVLKGCLQRDIIERWTASQVDGAAWGIGYGDVELDPALREEQRSQSQEHLVPVPLEEVDRGPPSWTIVDTPHSATPAQPGRAPSLVPRSQSRSRSRSPNTAPRTPEDDDGVSSGYFTRRTGRQAPREDDDVQIVGGEEFCGRDVDVEDEADDLAMRPEDVSDKKRREHERGRQDAPKECDGDRQKSQSRTRSWTLGNLQSSRMRSRNG